MAARDTFSNVNVTKVDYENIWFIHHHLGSKNYSPSQSLVKSTVLVRVFGAQTYFVLGTFRKKT